MRDGDEAHAAVGEVRVELVEREPALLVDLEVAQRRAGLGGEQLPGDDVRVVLGLREDDRVAGAHVLAAPRVGDEVERLGRVLRDDRLGGR